MNRITKRLGAVGILLAMQSGAVAVAVEPIQAPASLPPPATTKTPSAPSPITMVTPTSSFQPEWITLPGATDTIPMLHVRVVFDLNEIPTAALIESVVGKRTEVRLNGNVVVSGDDEERSVDAAAIDPACFVGGMNVIDVVGHEVTKDLGAIVLLQMRLKRQPILVGTTANCEVSPDGLNWVSAQKTFAFGDTQSLVPGNPDEGEKIEYSRYYAETLVGQTQSLDPIVAGNAVRDLTLLSMKNKSLRFYANNRLGKGMLWTLRDELLEVLTDHLARPNRNLQKNALHFLARLLETDPETPSLLAGPAMVAMVDSSLRPYSEPVILSSLLESLTAASTATSEAVKATKAGKAAVAATKKATKSAKDARQSKEDELNAIDQRIRELDQRIGDVVAESVVATRIIDGQTKSIRVDQRTLQPLQPQEPQAIILRKRIRDTLEALRDQKAKVGANESLLRRLKAEAKLLNASRAPLALELLQAAAAVEEAMRKETATSKQQTKLEGASQGLTATLHARTGAINEYLDRNAFSTSVGQMLEEQLKAAMHASAMAFYGIEVETAEPPLAGSGVAAVTEYGARAPASEIPTATDFGTVGYRPGVAKTAPFSSEFNPRDRSVSILEESYPEDEHGGPNRLLRSEVQAARPGVRGAESAVEPAPGATGAVSAIPPTPAP